MSDPNEIDDTLDGVADDTVVADADDTLAADADDTVVADGGDDTVAADAGKSPFDEFDEPVAKEKKPEVTPPADLEDDGLDKRLAAAEDALEADPTDPEAHKLVIKLNRQARERDHKENKLLKAQVRENAADAGYERFVKSCGLPDAPAEVRKRLSQDEIYARFAKHKKAALADGDTEDQAVGAARANLRHEIKQIIAAAGKNKPSPKTKRTESGATLSPPGGGGGRQQGKAAPDPERAFIDGNWSYPNPVGEA